MKKKLSTALNSLTGVLIVLATVITFNIALSAVRLKKDMTEENIYTISKGTIKLLGDLKQDVTLKLYFSRSNENAPIPLKQYAQRVRDLLREYETHSKGRLIFETYDPKPDSEAEEWAQRYGLTSQTLGTAGMQPDFYLGLVAVSGPQEGAIPFLAPGMEPQLEYMITQLIYKTTQKEKPKIGVMSSLPVMGKMDPMSRQAPQKWVLLQELNKQYEIVPLAPDADEIPDHINLVLLIHPKNLAEKTLFGLDQFVLRGGKLLVFMDPLCVAERETAGEETGYGFLGAASDLNRLTKAWGIQISPGEVVADLQAASTVGFGAGGTERMPTWLSLRGENINREEIVASPLELLMMPFAGAFTGQPAEGLTMTTLVHSSQDAMLVNAFVATQPGAEKMKEARPAGEIPLAIRLQGKFKTAFPGGLPRKEDDQGEKKKESGSVLKESSQEGAVVLMSDVDMIYDRFCVRELNFFGQTLTSPINDNVNFTLNLSEELSGSDALIGLRSRGTYDRPFYRVIELEQRAQQKWQQEELKLVARLQETQARINQLQQVKKEDQQFILSPEQKAEIEKFRRQRFETQRQLKEVRKNLRRDIERLGLTLKIFCMAFIPALVAFYGIYHGWQRRKKNTG